VAKSGNSIERRLAKRIAERIRRKRAAAQLSQEQLGERAQIHRTYIGAIERGEKNATVVTLAKIARALRCRLIELIPEDVSG
jgi:transcriptional regulator with XRE-family HTH domain